MDAGIERLTSSLDGRQPPILAIAPRLPEPRLNCQITSAMPNSPTATGTKSSPSASSLRPNVNRHTALSMSMPTSPKSTPTDTIEMAFSGEPWASTTAPTSPSTISAKYSGAPKLAPT